MPGPKSKQTIVIGELSYILDDLVFYAKRFLVSDAKTIQSDGWKRPRSEEEREALINFRAAVHRAEKGVTRKDGSLGL
jgi:hypothetical protein|tara:strand:- start:52 stop:285 length:234 start_codon:yes stop_codon:yes gene_type:complete